MLTALSVARDCGMIEKQDKLILALVTPPIASQKPSIEWVYAEDTKTNVTEIQTITQVLNNYTEGKMFSNIKSTENIYIYIVL